MSCFAARCLIEFSFLFFQTGKKIEASRYFSSALDSTATAVPESALDIDLVIVRESKRGLAASL